MRAVARKIGISIVPLFINDTKFCYCTSPIFYSALIPLIYLISGNIMSSLCIITKTIPTAAATSNNGKTLLCPSACKKVLNPNGLTAKNDYATRIDESIANSLLSSAFFTASSTAALRKCSSSEIIFSLSSSLQNILTIAGSL